MAEDLSELVKPRLRRGRSKVETATSFVNLHGGSYCQEPPIGQLSIPGVSCNEEFSHKSELLMDPRVSGKRVPGKKIDRGNARMTSTNI